VPLTSNPYGGEAYSTRARPDVVSVGEELREIDQAEFDQCWPAMLIDLLIVDDVGIPELAKLLCMVRDRYRVANGVQTRRRCSICRELKKSHCFAKHASGADGLRPQCKLCEQTGRVRAKARPPRRTNNAGC